MFKKVFIALVFFVFVSPSQALFAEGVENHTAVNIGWERLKYTEDEPDTGLTSEAVVNNLSLDFEWIKRLHPVFIGVRGVFPVVLGETTEEWKLSGAPNQTNDFNYRWTRVDGYVGYPVSEMLNPYGGFRWSHSEQERTNFVVSGTQYDIESTETVSSWSLIFGVRGVANLSARTSFDYRLQYLAPFQNKVENSYIPNFEATGSGGYGIEAEGGVYYLFSERVSLGLKLYGGKKHWDGSGWIPIGGGYSSKWPENDTDFMGAVAEVGVRL